MISIVTDTNMVSLLMALPLELILLFLFKNDCNRKKIIIKIKNVNIYLKVSKSML